MGKFVACDIETTGLDFLKDKILCIGFSDGHYYTDIREGLKYLSELKIAGNAIVFQNGSFDTKFIWAFSGIQLVQNDFDTMVAAYLLTDAPTRLSLDSLVSYYLGFPSWKQDIKSGAIFEDPELMRMYCVQDATYTKALADVLTEKLIEEGKLEFFEKLMEARRMLTAAEYTGVKFDIGANDALIGELSAQLDTRLHELNVLGETLVQDCPLIKKAGFNWNSPKQVLWLLKKLGLSTVNPMTKKESADVFVLEMNQNKHPLIKELIGMRGTKKLLSTLGGYKEAVRLDGALHPNFNCTNTRTGRLSSSGDLNFQQCDKDPKVRSLFVARPGFKLVIGDLAQIEPRLAAHYSRDPVLCQMFERNEDLYGTIACQILGADCAPNEVKGKYPSKRAVAKVIGLSVLYGIGVNKLRNTIENDGGVSGFTVFQAREVIDAYFTKFRGLRDLQKNVHRAVTGKGHLVNLYGRKVDVSEDEVFMTGVNSLIQSSASDYLLFKVNEFMKISTPQNRLSLLGLVHDEVILEVPNEYAEVTAEYLKNHMENAPNIRVPIKFEVSIGDNWSAKA